MYLHLQTNNTVNLPIEKVNRAITFLFSTKAIAFGLELARLAVAAMARLGRPVVPICHVGGTSIVSLFSPVSPAPG
jgi:hypothetical protein